jgi:hypothetical protein
LNPHLQSFNIEADMFLEAEIRLGP